MKYQVWFGQCVAVCVGFHISVGVVVGDVFCCFVVADVNIEVAIVVDVI
mgnify:CR=1 FL=1